MSAEFTIRIDKVLTTSNDLLQDMVKQVSWTMLGNQDGCYFELPQMTVLPDSEVDDFIPLGDITESDVINWVQEHTLGIDGIKSHIQLVLDKESAKKLLVEKPLPWAPLAPATPMTPVPIVEPMPDPIPEIIMSDPPSGDIIESVPTSGI